MASHLEDVVSQYVLRPRKRFGELASDHVPFDELTSETRFEAKALDAVCSGERHCVAIVGSTGAGKSSLIAKTCANLPANHVALRVPVVGVNDPTDVHVVAAMTLATALGAVEMEAHQRQAIEQARADSVTSLPAESAVSGKLGGGAFPVSVGAELKTLTEQHRIDALAGDRLAGIDRLVSILVAAGTTPVFVLEDTEAAIGLGSEGDVEAFFNGPVRAFISEVDAALLIAIQRRFVDEAPAYSELRPALIEIELPSMDLDTGTRAVRRIIDHRLGLYEFDFDASAVAEDDALSAASGLLTGRFAGSIRHTLVTLHGAGELATEDGHTAIGPEHVKKASLDWMP